MATASVSMETRNGVSDMCAHIAALEEELKEMKALRNNSARIPNGIEAMEAVIARMKNSVKDDNEGTAGLSRSDDGRGNADGNNVQCCFNWFIEKISMMLGCFSMSSEDRNYSAGENVTSPLIDNRTGSTEIAANIDGTEKKSFLEWLNHHELGQCKREWESVLTRLTEGVIWLGIRLSGLLLDFFFSASENGDNMEIFGVFRDTLESRILEDDKNLVVAIRVFRLLETVEKEVRNLRNNGEGSSKVEIRKDLIRKRKQVVDKLINNFWWQINCLDTFVSKLLLTRSVLVKTMEESFGECEAQLNKIEQEISKLRLHVVSSFKEDSETVKILKMQLELKVRELWSGLRSG